MLAAEKAMTVGELKEKLADFDDDMQVMVMLGKRIRFYNAGVDEMEIDMSASDSDGGYVEVDVFTRKFHRKKVILVS